MDKKSMLAVNELTSAGSDNILKLDSLTIDTQKRTVTVDGMEVELTKTEFGLLTYLVSNKGVVLSRERIMSKVWGYDYMGRTNVVDVYIRYLRTKIDDRFNMKFIHTLRGSGYFAKEQGYTDAH